MPICVGYNVWVNFWILQYMRLDDNEWAEGYLECRIYCSEVVLSALSLFGLCRFKLI